MTRREDSLPKLLEALQKKRLGRRQFMRKALLLGLSFPAVSAILASCAQPEATATPAPAAATATPAPQPTATAAPAVQKRTALRMWMPTADQWDPFNKHVAEFAAKDEKVDLKLETTSFEEYYAKVTTALASGTAPDIIWHAEEEIGPFLRANQVDFMPQDIQEGLIDTGLYDSTKTALTRAGPRFYGYPLEVTTMAVFLNRKMYRDAGLDPDKPPDTWDELVEQGKKIAKWEGGKPVKLAYALRHKGNPMGVLDKFNILLYAWETDWVTPEGKSNLTAKPVAEALQFYVDLVQKHKIAALDVPSTEDQFMDEIAALLPRESWVIVTLAKERPKLDYSVFLSPKGPTGKRGCSLSMTFFIVPVQSKVKQEAWAFVDRLLSPENEATALELLGSLPLRKTTAAKVPKFAEDPKYKPFADALEYAKDYGLTPKLSEIGPIIITDVMQNALFGKGTVPDLLAEADKRIAAILEKA